MVHSSCRCPSRVVEQCFLEQVKLVVVFDISITRANFTRRQQQFPETSSVLERNFLNTPRVVPVSFADATERVDCFLERVGLKVAKVISNTHHVRLIEYSYKLTWLANKDNLEA